MRREEIHKPWSLLVPKQILVHVCLFLFYHHVCCVIRYCTDNTFGCVTETFFNGTLKNHVQQDLYGTLRTIWNISLFCLVKMNFIFRPQEWQYCIYGCTSHHHVEWFRIKHVWKCLKMFRLAKLKDANCASIVGYLFIL